MAAFAFLAVGCGDRDQITRYTVELPPAASLPEHRAGSVPRSRDAENPEDATLGAIVPHGSETWFFKIAAPIAAIGDEQQDAFVQFVKSVEFTERGPTWTLPDGWRQMPASGVRFATITIDDAEEPTELSVTKLPTGSGKLEDYVLLNVNRWRDELRLSPIDKDELAGATVSLQEDTGKPGWLVYLKGHRDKNAMGRPFAAPGGAKRKPAAAPARRPLPLTYDVPEGWKPAQAGSMSLATFEVQGGEHKVLITISAAGGGLAANVNRWRDQVHLKRLAPAAVEKSLRDIEIGDATGRFAELVGTDDQGQPETILGVIVEAAGAQWFFKLRGDAALAGREKARFEQFVQSVRFRESGKEDDGS